MPPQVTSSRSSWWKEMVNSLWEGLPGLRCPETGR